MKKYTTRNCDRRNPYTNAVTPKLYHRGKINYGRRAMYLLLLLVIILTLSISAIIYSNREETPNEEIITEKAMATIEVSDMYNFCGITGLGGTYGTSNAQGVYLDMTSPLVRKKLSNTYDVSTINMLVGADTLNLGTSILTNQILPTKYYGNIDFSSFQPYMSYKKITSKSSPAYKISHSENAYTDEYGFRRYKTNSENQITINEQDDYIVAMGTFYKEKGTAGERFLVTTTTGAFTVITGDEKADQDTDSMNMFTTHKGSAAILEWVVDEDKLESEVKQSGTVTSSSMEALHGTITSIYKIN